MMKRLTKEEILDIIFYLEKTELSLIDIGKAYNVSGNVISNINSGKSYRLTDVEYPIRKKKLDIIDVKEIVKLLIGDTKISEIAKKYNVSTSVINGINSGSAYYFKDLDYPIRKNREFNYGINFDTLQQLGCIYKYCNKLDGKIYVGKTVNLDARNFQHSIGDIHFDSIFKENPENFELSMIEVDVPIEKLNEREHYWIDKLNATDPKIGYNINF